MHFFHIPPGMEEALAKKAQAEATQKTPEQIKEEHLKMLKSLPANAIIINGDSMVKEVADDPSLIPLQPLPNDRSGVLMDVVEASDPPKE